MEFNFLEEILGFEKRNPDSIALVIGEDQYSYHHIISSAKSLSFFLKKHVKKNIPCILLSEKTHFFYELILACFLSKLIYTPININGSLDRNKKIIQSIDNAVILIGDIDYEKIKPFIPSFSKKKIFVLNQNLLKFFKKNNRVRYIALDTTSSKKITFPSEKDIAYLLFTSGSTGSPKGVPISYKNINAYLASVWILFPCDTNDHFSQISDIGFDISIHEILFCWSVGATLHVYDSNFFSSIVDFIGNSGITQLIVIPSMIDQIVKLSRYFKINFKMLKKTIVCGEPFPITYAKSWEKIAPNSTIINFYGPTEATVSCIYHCYNAKNDYSGLTTVPIGYPFPGVGIALTNQSEMVVSGEQVSSGYLFSDSKKNEKFQLSADKKINRYFTGDTAFFHKKYGFVFKERRDDQWQIRGYRIEKSEVENTLKLVTGFDDICVVPQCNSEKLIDYLCLFSLENFRLKDYEKELRSYLIPAAIPEKHFVIDAFPRFTNGKINYNRLLTTGRNCT
ncbi:MAG: AMP-binding protein [Coxiellaceae bacterium]|nr:AMP-binding protein [Coxiellaceae bacterium]